MALQVYFTHTFVSLTASSLAPVFKMLLANSHYRLTPDPSPENLQLGYQEREGRGG